MTVGIVGRTSSGRLEGVSASVNESSSVYIDSRANFLASANGRVPGTWDGLSSCAVYRYKAALLGRFIRGLR